MTQQRKLFDLIHHLEHIGYRQPEIGHGCDIHDMVSAIFADYDATQSWYANIGVFMIDMLGAYRTLERESEESMIAWLQVFAIELTEFELAQGAFDLIEEE